MKIKESGTVTQSTGSWYKVLLNNGEEVNARLKGKFRLNGKMLTNPIAVGDVVQVEPESAENFTIVNIDSRRNYLIRKSTKLSSRYQMVAANIDLAMILATLVQPRTSRGFIDRFLITCESFGIEASIVFNKTDLLDEELTAELQEVTELYLSMGYKVLQSSLVNRELDSAMKLVFQGKTTLVFGHSGVGKSTLINLLVPGSNQMVANISDYHGKGKHTTTFARMLITDDGSRIIDTPGVKEFGMEQLEPWKVSHYFRDFQPFNNLCKFNNCLHTDEPKCAVKDALMTGRIAESRYVSYLSILSDMIQN